MVVSGWWRDEVLRDDAWGCPIGSGMTVVVEIPRLAALARNDSNAVRMTVGTLRITVMAVMAVLRTMLRMVVEVLAWGAVVAAG